MKKVHKGKEARQQSALELLTTYSWAFLIIAIFIAAVVVLNGSRPPSTYLQATCNIDPAFPCAQAAISGYNSIEPITFTVLFTNDLGAIIEFPSNALNVTLTNVGEAGTNSYLGNCYPQIALQSDVIRCIANIPGTKTPPTGSQVGVNFNIKYAICKSAVQSSCSGIYKTTGYALQSISPPGTGIYKVSFITNPQSGKIFVNNIGYANGTSAFLVGGKYTIFALPPLGYYFSAWSISSTSSSLSSLTSSNTTLSLFSNSTIMATFSKVTTTTT
ncbi:MAG: InlB B-repeat-containing protein, partial [Candidatus Micrarchaeia archaeon]